MKVNLIGENTWFKVDITKMSEELREKIIKEANLDSDCISYDESLDNIEYYGNILSANEFIEIIKEVITEWTFE